jgi:DNA-directed RNA polymerase specialized sigma subunit
MELSVERTESLGWLLDKIAAPKKTGQAAISLSKIPITKEQKQKEVELWQRWKNNGEKPKDLDPLLKSFAPLLQGRLNMFKRAEVPTSAVSHEHKKYFVDALRKWDPKKGALGTWITWKIKRGARYVETHKNPARITENISQHIGSFNAVRSELAEKLGYEPDAQAIHDYSIKINHKKLKKLPLKDFRRLEAEQRKTFIEKGHESEETGATPNLSSRSEEVAHLIIPQLTPHERLVHEYTLGLNGKPSLKPGQIAKKLNMDNSKVAKLRTSVFNKMRPFLDE